ncbi:MAG: phage major capsid protein [Clostridiales bacterium]|nr:MAG: phage major capsid protein [Clostridiales bacterium]
MGYENIRLEKGMYHVSGKSFTQVLEELDPSQNYAGSDLDGLDAYQRQLKRYDIRVSGAGSDAVEKFFSTADSAALFPEYIARAVAQGIHDANNLNEIIATKTMVNGLDYRSITIPNDEETQSLKQVAEGAEIPTTSIKKQEKLVKLTKRGRMLEASYEAIRFQKLDLFTIALRQIGSYIAKTQFNDAVEVLLNGDGNKNPAAAVELTTSGNFGYADLVKLWNELGDFKMNAIVAGSGAMGKILNLDEVKDATAGLNFHGTGKLVTPLGATLVKSGTLDADTLLALDKTCALEMVCAGEVLVEYDKLIDRQLERAAITSIAGFSKIFADAVRKMEV